MEKLPLLALSAASCVTTLLAQTGAIHSSGEFPLPSRLGNALVACMVYLGQMVWPVGLAVLYPFPHNGTPTWEVALAGMLLASLSMVAWGERRTRPWLLIGWVWYLVMLLPVMGIIQVGRQAHADRYTYLPQIGIYVAVTWLAAEWGVKWRVGQAALVGLMTAVLAVLMVCAWKQTECWKDNETLWTHALACTTDDFVAHFKLGNVLMQKGKVDEAILHFQNTVQIRPAFAQAQNNLGGLLLQKGQVDEAIPHLQMALQINPNYGKAHINLANAFMQKGREDQAIVHFQNALQIDPANMEVQNNLAWLLATSAQASLRNGRKAVELARQANARTSGNNLLLLNTLAAALAEAGQFPEAVETARRALQLAEAQSNTNLARALQFELKLYQAGSPFHSPEQTH
jgi:Tfp pilus assembly protein PilF